MKHQQDVAKKVQDFFAAYRLQYLDKGKLLISAGMDPSGVFYLVGGQVRQYDISSRGDEMVVNVFKPQAFFPMSWAINKTPNTYYFEAYTRVMIRRAPAEDVLAFMHQNPDVVFDLLSRVYRGTDGLLGRIAHLMDNSARNRLLYELILSCERFGKAQPGGSTTLAISEVELAARVGLSRETVNREMSGLKKDNLVTVAHGTLTVFNVQALRDALNP